MIEINKIYHDDCMNILKQLPDKSIDLVLTDPPYGGGGRIKNEVGSAEDLTNTISAKRTGGTWSKKYQTGGIFDNEITHWDFAPTKEYFDEIFRVSKNQIIWGGNYFGLPPTRCFLVWDKLTISEVFSMAMCEYAWTSFNGNAKRKELAPQDSARFHPTQKPLELFKWCLNLFSKENELILDCFSGSGTTAVACSELKRNFICIEKDKQYYEMSVRRLEEYNKQLKLF